MQSVSVHLGDLGAPSDRVILSQRRMKMSETTDNPSGAISGTLSGVISNTPSDNFLLAMRETGDWHEACVQAGITLAESESLCENRAYHKAVIELQLEYIEETLDITTRKLIDDLTENKENQLANLRVQAYADYETSHNG